MKRCPRCGELVPLDGYHKRARSKDGRQGWCRDCMLQYMATEERRVYTRAYMATHPEVRRAAESRYREKNLEKVREKERSARKPYHNAHRARALAVYGGACAHCTKSEGRLHLTHVNGDGDQYRSHEGARTMIIRISKLGTRLPWPALELLCVRCHRRKTTREARGRSLAP